MKLDINWKDPIILSISCGIVTFILSFLVFAILKPKLVTKMTGKRKHKIDWSKLAVFSLVSGVLVALIVFLWKMQGDVNVETQQQLLSSGVY